MNMQMSSFVAVAVLLVALPASASTLRDDCWLWGHETGQLDSPTNRWGLPVAKGYYHQAQACRDFGVSNLCCIRWDKPPRAFRDSLRGLKRLTWPMSGHKKEVNSTYDALADWNFSVADEMPNVTGFDLDDYFVARGPSIAVETSAGRRMVCPTRFPYAQLVELRRRLDAYPRRLELRLVVYDELRDQRKDPKDLVPVLELVDSVTYWTWKAKSLPKLPEYFRRYRALAPGKRTYLGIYLWDFGGTHGEISAEDMKFQLDFALEKWKSREIDGVVFLATSICNRDFTAVKMAHDWIEANGHCTR